MALTHKALSWFMKEKNGAKRRGWWRRKRSRDLSTDTHRSSLGI